MARAPPLNRMQAEKLGVQLELLRQRLAQRLVVIDDHYPAKIAHAAPGWTPAPDALAPPRATAAAIIRAIGACHPRMTILIPLAARL